jgi:hypothetical protein
MTREIGFAPRPLWFDCVEKVENAHQQNLRTSELIVDFG